jgi:hypothetical protein
MHRAQGQDVTDSSGFTSWSILLNITTALLPYAIISESAYRHQSTFPVQTYSIVT